MWAVAAYGMHWGIYAIMGIAFWYHLTGLAVAPFIVGEELVGWCRVEAIRWVRAFARPPAFASVTTRQTEDGEGGDASLP